MLGRRVESQITDLNNMDFFVTINLQLLLMGKAVQLIVSAFSAQIWKRKNFRFEARRNKKLERIQSKSASSYNGTPVEQESATTVVCTVASGLDSTGHDLRAKILEMRAKLMR
jgi:hypothetical protein